MNILLFLRAATRGISGGGAAMRPEGQRVQLAGPGTALYLPGPQGTHADHVLFSPDALCPDALSSPDALLDVYPGTHMH